MLLGRILLLLVGQDLQGPISRGRVSFGSITSSMYPRRRRQVGRVEALFVLRDQRRSSRRPVGGLVELFAIHDVDRPLRPHHRDIGRRPGQRQVGAQVLAAHRHVGPADGFACYQRDLGDRRLDVGVQDFGPMANDAAVFLGHAGRNPGVSTKVMTGRLKASHSSTKREILSAESISSTPARYCGCCATIPTAWPSSRAKPTMALRAKSACTSRKLSWSKTRPITSSISYASLAASGTMLFSASSARADRPPAARKAAPRRCSAGDTPGAGASAPSPRLRLARRSGPRRWWWRAPPPRPTPRAKYPHP